MENEYKHIETVILNLVVPGIGGIVSSNCFSYDLNMSKSICLTPLKYASNIFCFLFPLHLVYE